MNEQSNFNDECSMSKNYNISEQSNMREKYSESEKSNISEQSSINKIWDKLLFFQGCQSLFTFRPHIEKSLFLLLSHNDIDFHDSESLV